MAKQTFTVGQVLTAAQMTSLQETAMGGGAASTKTASYVLVAADAGTTVAMNAAGATTITVNTGLFSAGDTVFIQNIGAGATTITAGTATVDTAGSLILPQYDAGILYFTSASAAIFYDYIQVGAASPLTTKGDIYVYGTSDTRLPVGTDGFTLVADSVETTGLKWVAPAGGGMTLLSTTTLSNNASIDITGISQSYTDLLIVTSTSIVCASASHLRIRPETDSSTKYAGFRTDNTFSVDSNGYPFGTNFTTTNWDFVIRIYNYANTTNEKRLTWQMEYLDGSGIGFGTGLTSTTAAIDNIAIQAATGNLTSGVIKVYGI